MIHAAASRLETLLTLVALVVTGHELAGVFVGDLFEAWKNREDEGVLYVPRAGEILYRQKNKRT